MSEDSEFAMIADADRNPVLQWQGQTIGHLAKGRSLLQPAFRPIKEIATMEPESARAVAERAEIWIKAQLEKHLGGIAALETVAQDPAIDGQVRALSVQLAESAGIAGRNFVADAVAALDKDARAAARKNGIIFGALDVFHHLALKPAAVRWRSALFAAYHGKPMPELPPESAVLLKDWRFESAADCRNAGFRRIGTEHVRIDLAERIIKKAHEARGQGNVAAMDMAFVTSLGLGAAGLEHLLRDAGFRPMAPPAMVVETEAPAEPDAEPQVDANADELVTTAEAIIPEIEEPVANEPSAAEPETLALAADEVQEITEVTPATDAAVELEATPTPTAAVQPAVLSYWRWIGIKRKPLVSADAKRAPRPEGQHAGKKRPGKPTDRPKQSQPVRTSPPSPPSALALQLAALQLGKKT